MKLECGCTISDLDDGTPQWMCEPCPAHTKNDWRRAYKAAALTGWLAAIAGKIYMDEYEDEPEAFAQHLTAVAKTCAAYADALLAEDAKP